MSPPSIPFTLALHAFTPQHGAMWLFPPRSRVLAALLTLLVTTTVVLSQTAPRVQADGSFDARRAATTLARVIPRDVPHPVSSVEHAALRDRIVAELRALGYAPEVQKTFVCNWYASCATIENILAAPPSANDVVLVTAHYDSVPASSGGCDDGAGVAVLLEAANVLRSRHLPRNVAFLFTDAEELGLLGAEAFVRDHPLARRVAAVVNIDNRGCSGASLLFEVAGDEARTMRALRLRQPHTSSLFREIYKRLPNDTDFTVFRRAGMTGVNFALIGDGALYHTVADAPHSLESASLQQHGENALAATTALAALGKTEPRSAVFFDLFHAGIVAWPVGANVAIILVLVLLAAMAVVLTLRNRGEPLRLVGALASWVAAAIGAFALGLGIIEPFLSGPSFIATAAPLIAAAAAIGVIAALALTLEIDRSTAAAQTLLWTSLSIAAFLLAPGALFIPAIPAFAAAIAALLDRAEGEVAKTIGAMLLPFAVVATLVPLAALLYPGLGVVAMPALAVIVMLTVSSVAPLIAARRVLRWTLVAVAAVVVVAGFVLALRGDRIDARTPAVLNAASFTDESRTLVSAMTRGVRPRALRGAEWSDGAALHPSAARRKGVLVRTSAHVPAPLPGLTTTERTSREGGRSFGLTIAPSPGAKRVVLSLHAASRVRELRVNGVPVEFSARAHRAFSPGWLRVRIAVSDGERVAIDLETLDRREVAGYVEQVWFGIGREGADVLQARSASLLPADDGDVTIARRNFMLR